MAGRENDNLTATDTVIEESATLLRPQHLVSLVESVSQKSDASVIGIHSSSPPSESETMSLRVQGREVPVIYCGSVLAVREALDSNVPNQGLQLVILTPLTDDELGWDVLVRLARRRLHVMMTPWDLLKDVFRVQHVDPRLTMYTWMPQVLLERMPAERYPPVPSGMLDADTAWGHLLAQTLGLRTGRPDAEALLVATLDPTFDVRYGTLPDQIRSAVADRIGETAGRLGWLMMGSIEEGKSQLLVPIGLACSVLFPQGEQGSMELERAAVRLEQYLAGRAIDPQLGKGWATAARRVLDGSPESQHAQIYQQAEELLQELRADAFVGLSDDLPAGYQRRLDSLGRAIVSCLAESCVLADVEEAVEQVEMHREASRKGEGERIERLRMAVRLVRYLKQRAAQRTPSGASLSDVASAYAEDGSYVDRARMVLLGGEQHGALALAFNEISERVRQVREQENNLFAKRLAEWNRSPKIEPGLIPIEGVLDECVVSVARTSPLLLLVLDGMGFASFRQLHEQLILEGWGEWSIHQNGRRSIGLAVSPSITRLSRASLFAGRLTAGVSGDEKRNFREHAGLISVSKSKKLPILFHKGDLSEGATSSLADDVRDAMRDSEQRVVGIVLNVLDDWLAKSDQVVPRWTPDRIRLLHAILYEARLAGRIVVLTSDHGHVLEADGILLPGSGEERWRKSTGSVAIEEIMLEGPRIEAASGEPRIIVPWSERVRYVRKKAGYHGGAAPQEMLVPIAVLASTDRKIEGWTPLLEQPPAWWTAVEKPGDQEVTESRPARIASPPRKHVPRSQESMNLFASEHDQTKSVSPPDMITQLIESPVFASQRSLAGRHGPSDKEFRALLNVLRRNSWRASRSLVSSALNLPEALLREVLSAMQRILNLDGYPILTVDEGENIVKLDVEMMRKGFQVGE